jgi:hypothetical protein
MNILIQSNERYRPPTSGWLWLAFAHFLVLAICLSGPSGGVLAQDNPSEAGIEADQAPEVSRDEWRQRVQDAKRRAREVAIDRRSHPELYVVPLPTDPEIEATERVLNDDSLKRGDIVSTKNGLFVFRGRVDQQRRDGDFVKIPSR